MLPKYHILYGAIFAFLTYQFLSFSLLNASLIFLASVLIDVDHYMFYVYKKKDFNLKKAYSFFENLRNTERGRTKSTLMIFHTIEFLVLTTLLSFVWQGFFYILIGLLLHSFLDIIELSFSDELHLREFSLIRYFIISYKNKDYYF